MDGGSPIFSLDRNPEVTFGPSGSVARWRMEEDGGGNADEFLRTVTGESGAVALKGESGVHSKPSSLHVDLVCVRQDWDQT